MKPNVIIINPDQMRADTLAHLGNPASITPNIDRFVAEDAVSYRNAFCQNPVCVPSRCSFLTGLYPHVRGHRTMEYMLRDGEPSLLSELKDAGYYVWMNSRNDFLPAQIEGSFERHVTETFYGGDVPAPPGTVNPNPRGTPDGKNFYSFYFGELQRDNNGKNYTYDDESVDQAIEKIHTRGKDQPFCLFLGLQLPHPPYQIEEPYFSAIDKKKLLPRISAPDGYRGKPKILQRIAEEQRLQDLTEEDWDNLRACYLGMCRKVDDYVGKLCAALKSEGVYDNTLILFFADHGDYTGDYSIAEKTQNTFEDCLVKVPLIIKPPAQLDTDAGISDSLVELVDIYATVMELCGVQPTHSHFSRSLLPSLVNRAAPTRDYVCAEGGRLASEKHCNETNGTLPSKFSPYYPRMVAQLDDVAHTKATMIRSAEYKYIKRLYEDDEFYDLTKDPAETVNEIHNPVYKEIIDKMRLEQLDWYQETCDIVPFDWDERFNFDMIWSRIKYGCPEDLKEEAQRKIREELDMYGIQEWLRAKLRSRGEGQK